MNTELIYKYNMLPRGTRLLCAVSGGADSMCLIHLMLSMREELGISVCAAHYEHGIRGEESLRDAKFVEDYCRENGVELMTEHGSVEGYARANSMGTEEAARELRYDFLQRAAAALKCDKIATAHNCDDNGETMLFNLCRGSGGAGLRGIPPVRGNIVRPILGCTRAEIEAYLRENHVPHVEDSTNSSDDYSRNIIRHKVMPVLREINPGFSAAALRAAELMREDESFLSDAAERFIKKEFDGESLSCGRLIKQPPAISGRVIRRLVPQSLPKAQVEAVLEFAKGTGLGYIDIPGLRLRREQGRLYFKTRELPAMEERELVPGSVIEIPEAGLRIRSEIAVKSGEVNDLFKTFCFKYESICDKILLTGRKPGDNIRPQGRNCTKSLKKLFTEAAYNSTKRNITPVFRDEKGVLAVYGLAIDERARAAEGDKILRIRIEKI